MKLKLGYHATLILSLTPILGFANQGTSKEAIVSLPSNLYDAPSYKSQILKKSAVGTELIIGKRYRAWYQVEQTDFSEAWIKMLAVRLKQNNKREGELGVVSLMESMTTKPTSSTAVRGFDEHTLGNATPNIAALAVIGGYKPSKSELKTFVNDGKLTEKGASQ